MVPGHENRSHFRSTEFPSEEDYGVGLYFFFGALLYELDATMAYLEAINDDSFQGSALNRFLQGYETDLKKMLDDKSTCSLWPLGSISPCRG